MQFFFTFGLLAAIVTATCSEKFIHTAKITPSYWRATLSCPPFNLLTPSFFQDYYALIAQIEADSNVKVIVFDSSAPDFWLNHFDVLNPPSKLILDAYWGNVIRLANLPVITVAAIRGIASGGGAEIAAGLDVRFGSLEKAVFTQNEVGVGVVPGGGGLGLLPRLIGRARALEVIIGADNIDAKTAADYGWLNRAIPEADFEKFVDRFARRVAAWDHEGIAAAKKIINKRSVFPSLMEWQEEFTANAANFNRTVVQNRIAAFKEAGLQNDLLAEGLARLEAEDYEYREPDSDDDDPEFVLSEDLDVSGLRPDFLTTLVDMFCLYNENMIPPDVRGLIVLPGHGEEGEQLPMYPADSTIGNSPAYEG